MEEKLMTKGEQELEKKLQEHLIMYRWNEVYSKLSKKRKENKIARRVKLSLSRKESEKEMATVKDLKHESIAACKMTELQIFERLYGNEPALGGLALPEDMFQESALF